MECIQDQITQNRFAALCEEYLIHPAIALENEQIVRALQGKEPEQVIRRLLETEY